ncbi:MAG TPA: MarR family transcriptional regulator [Microvirga sp.]|jgi:DNA-binding MarR family transcriptional regulator|nr:MarR family transcriptional regulator [Microvirga sp.]
MLTNSDEEPLGFLLLDVTRSLRARIDEALERAGLGLTPGEARTLVHAARFGSVHQRALAGEMGIEPMTLVRYLHRLEERGLIRREVDPDDRRANRIHVTPAARASLREVRNLARRVREEAMRGLSPAEIAALRSSLLTMRANMTAKRSEAV